MAKKAIVKAQQTEVLVGAAPDGAGRAGEKGEIISPLRATELPPDFDFIASKTADEKVEYIRAVLARGEDEAVAIIAPALQLYGTAAFVVEAYLPLILEVKRHVCRPGRPRLDPATGERNRTWEEICEEQFHMSIRRMQQILASLRQPKLLRGASAASRKPPVDRGDYERARRVAAPAASLAKSVVIEGLGDRFPEAIEILRLADIPVPSPQPAAIAEAIQEPDWKGILAGLVGTLERYADRLPTEVVKTLEATQTLLGEKATPPAAATSVHGGTSGNESAAEVDCESLNSSPVTEPVAEAAGGAPPRTTGAAEGDPVTSPGDWITFDSTCKYVGRFVGRKGKSKRFVVMRWKRKPCYGNPTGWYQSLADIPGYRLPEEVVREKFPRAWQEWCLLHPEGAPGAAPQAGPDLASGGAALPTSGPAPQPSDDVSDTVTQEPREAAAATPTEVGQAAAVADAGSGGVA